MAKDICEECGGELSENNCCPSCNPDKEEEKESKNEETEEE